MYTDVRTDGVSTEYEVQTNEHAMVSLRKTATLAIPHPGPPRLWAWGVPRSGGGSSWPFHNECVVRGPQLRNFEIRVSNLRIRLPI